MFDVSLKFLARLIDCWLLLMPHRRDSESLHPVLSAEILTCTIVFRSTIPRHKGEYMRLVLVGDGVVPYIPFKAGAEKDTGKSLSGVLNPRSVAFLDTVEGPD